MDYLPTKPASHRSTDYSKEMSFWATIRATVWKALGVGAYVAKWGVIAHCTLEYIGDFVIVSTN